MTDDLRDSLARAVERAAAHRRALHRAEPRFAHYTAAALAEQVEGVAASPFAAARGAVAGWLPAGLVLDGIAGAEFRVWLHPATGRVKTERLDPAAPEVPPPALPDAPYFDGARLRWVDPEGD